ncbi:MAG: ribosome recycling factor [Candidatus Porifericomitaceae bacterium WSBS_2022_MAG_OTU9]
MSLDAVANGASQRMEKSLVALDNALKGLRTGRAHPDLLNGITVSCYGSESPLSQVAKVDVADARTLAVSVWDSSLLAAIDKSIRNSNTGLNPVPGESGVLRIPLPPLSEERRQEMVKIARNETEQTRVAIRNIRRDAMREMKQKVDAKEASEDEQRRSSTKLQQATDKFIADADGRLENKQKELMTV